MANIYFTSSELLVWKDRMINGPYKTTGDVDGKFSPGDYDRILSQATTFNSNPSADRYIFG